jgi:photosystem II stability/assembly factor-like uncharacterized protein
MLVVRGVAWSLAGVVVLLVASVGSADETEAPQRRWETISDEVLEQLEQQGIETAWPGGTAGVGVDPKTGDVYMIVAGQGVWKSSDQGKSFARCDGGKVSGRCETSYALCFDPAGQRLACFMLDGKCAWTGDSGKTWHALADVGRNWDFAAVDWSTPEVRNIFAGLHESGGKVMFSGNGGQAWTELLRDAEFDKSGGLGIFDGQTLVYTQKGKGIQRSTDAGQTWKKVADFQPTGRVARVLGQRALWLSPEGILASDDRGATWSVASEPVEGSIGPMVDPSDEKRMVVAGAKGIFQTADGGQTWKLVTASLPPEFTFPKPGWYANIAWDPRHNVFYASQMGKPTYRLK